jgi:hypothetical protein
MNEHAYKTDDFMDFSAINAIPVITVDSALSSTSTNPVQNKAIYTELAGKQSKLTFDSSPTSGSSNPVTSGGIYTAISNKMDKVTSVGSSSKPIYIDSSGVPTACSYSIGTAASYGVTTSVTSGSSSLVTSGAVYNAINSATGFECTIYFPTEHSSWGGLIGYFKSGTSSSTAYEWVGGNTKSPSFPFGTSSVYLSNGAKYVGAVSYANSTYTGYSITNTYLGCNLSAKGSGSVKLYGIFRTSGYVYGCNSSSTKPYIQFNFSSGSLSSISSNLRWQSSGESGIYMYLYSIDSIAVS